MREIGCEEDETTYVIKVQGLGQEGAYYTDGAMFRRLLELFDLTKSGARLEVYK